MAVITRSRSKQQVEEKVVPQESGGEEDEEGSENEEYPIYKEKGDHVNDDEEEEEQEEEEQEEQQESGGGDDEEEEEEEEESEEEEDKSVKKFNLRPRESIKRLYQDDSDDSDDNHVYHSSRYTSRKKISKPITQTRAGRVIKKPKYYFEVDSETEKRNRKREVNNSNPYQRVMTPIVSRTRSSTSIKNEVSPPGHSSIRTRRTSTLDTSAINLNSLDFGRRRKSVSPKSQESMTIVLENDEEEESSVDSGEASGDVDIVTTPPTTDQSTSTTTTSTAESRKKKALKRLEMEQILPASNSRRVRIPTNRYDPNHTGGNDSISSKQGQNRHPKAMFRPRMGGRRGSTGDDNNDDSDNDMGMGRGGAGGFGKGPMPININSFDASVQATASGGSAAASEPLQIDTSVGFEQVGGLDGHIRLLKEMLILPLVYPEVFGKFEISAPKGVLFYGPPGTGKTLVARALVNECNRMAGGKQRISFFMRKGADCLSKWVGEAERQLRMLFEQAKAMQPSIIFFDEIDGLAPVRSSRQDHIHSSIVSTLLALMDGLDSRGQVIVIGATNRVDSIDPALRRPGRFDRELMFALPDAPARKRILEIHTKSWVPPLPEPLIQEISERAAGYCGADIKALCSESVLGALRSAYPQIYTMGGNKYLLNVDTIKVDRNNFIEAMRCIVPTSKRSVSSFSSPLAGSIKPLLDPSLEQLVTQNLPSIFPKSQLVRASVASQQNGVRQGQSMQITNYAVYRPRLLIGGAKGMCQTQLGNALLYHLEEFPTFSIDICTLLSDPTSKSIEESCCRLLNEAKKAAPSVLYLCNIDRWFEIASLANTLTNYLANMDSDKSVLIIATIEQPKDNIPTDISDLFHLRNDSLFIIDYPSDENLLEFYRNIFFDIKNSLYLSYQKKIEKKRELEVLPTVPIATDDQRDKKRDDQLIRQLRILLRETLSKIIYDRRYAIFFRDVNIETNPEYYEMIQTPMSLYRITTNMENYKYSTVSHFLEDIDLIVSNTIEYYRVHDQFGVDAAKSISRAKQMQDEVIQMIEQFDPVLIKTCENIEVKRAQNPKRVRPPIVVDGYKHTNSRQFTTSLQEHEQEKNEPKIFTRSARLRGEASEITKEMMDSFINRPRKKRSSTEPPPTQQNGKDKQDHDENEDEQDKVDDKENNNEQEEEEKENEEEEENEQDNSVNNHNSDHDMKEEEEEQEKTDEEDVVIETEQEKLDRERMEEERLENELKEKAEREQEEIEVAQWYTRDTQSEEEIKIITEMVRRSKKRSIEELLQIHAEICNIIRRTTDKLQHSVSTVNVYNTILDAISTSIKD